MRAALEHRGHWWWLLAHTVFVHAVTTLIRPTAAYRAIELGVPTAWLGALSAAFAIVPLMVALRVGAWLDRRGERPVLTAGTALMLVSAAGFVIPVHALLWLLACSVVMGLGHLMSVVGQQSLVGTMAPGGPTDASFGHYAFVASIGQAVGPLLIVMVGGSSATPPTETLFMGALLGALLAVGCAWALDVSSPRPTTLTVQRKGAARSVLRLPGLGPVLLVSLTVLAAVDLLAVYLPALGAERGVSAAAIGVLLVLRAAASMVSRLFLGRLSARLGSRRLLVLSTASAAVAMAALPFNLPLAVVGVLVVLAGLGLGVGQPLSMAWVVRLAPDELRGTALSLRLTGNRLGQTAMPAALGLVAAGAGAAGVLWALAAVLGCVTLLASRVGSGAGPGPPAGEAA